jgi:DNA-binding transcriptional MerR regulator
VAQELAAHGLLGAATDARVSAAPDARTVRYYTTLGLLDRPRIESRQARYGKRHLCQLLAVKALQSADLPLAEIQQRLYGRSDKELEHIVAVLSTEAQETVEELPALRLREFSLESRASGWWSRKDGRRGIRRRSSNASARRSPRFQGPRAAPMEASDERPHPTSSPAAPQPPTMASSSP